MRATRSPAKDAREGFKIDAEDLIAFYDEGGKLVLAKSTQG